MSIPALPSREVCLEAAPSWGRETVLSPFLIFGIIQITRAMPGIYGWLVLSFADTVILQL